MVELLVWMWVAVGGSLPQTAGAATGTISGRVVDSSGAARPAVSVTITSDALMTARSTVTSDEGRYAVPSLPPGDYSIDFTQAGFAPHRVERVRVSLGFTANVDVVLTPAKHEEAVTVTARTPLVDPRSTARGATFDADALANLPASRTMGAVLQATPAVYTSRFDVGGSGPQTGLYGAYGTYGFNQPHVEGISIGSINTYSLPLDYGAFEEITVGTASNGIEWASPGVFTQFTVRSGGNRYRGSLYADFEHRSWQAANVDADQIRRGAAGTPQVSAQEGNQIWSYHDINADIGGYLRRDRLWWYGSLREQQLATRLVNFPVQPLDTDVVAYTGKVTARLADNHRLIAFGQGGRTDQPTRLDPFGLGGVTGASAIHRSVGSTADSRGWGSIWKVSWNAEIRNALLVELHAGQFDANRRERPNGTGPRTEDVVRLEITGGGRDWRTDLRRDQVSGTVSYAPARGSGSHFLTVRGTAEHLRASETWTSGYPGDVLHVRNNGAAAEVFLLQTPSRSENGTWWFSVQASDTWRLPRTTLVLGLRFDHHRIFLPPQVHPAGRFNPTPQLFPAVDNLIDWTGVVPRLGAVFDLTGDSRTLVKLSAGDYRVPNTEDIGPSANPNPRQWWRRHAWQDFNQSGAWDPGESGALLAARGGTTTEILSPDLQVPRSHEATAFLETNPWSSISVHSGVVWRTHRRGYQRVNVSRPPAAFTTPVVVRDPGPDNLPGTGDDGEPVQVWQLAAAYLAVPPSNVLQTVPNSSSEHWSWEAGVRVRQRRGWSVAAAFVHTWSQEPAAMYLGQTIRQNLYAYLPNDFINTDEEGRHVFRVWSAKVAATWAGPWDVRVTPVLRHQSGQPFGRTFVTALNYNRTTPILAEPIGTRRQDHVTLLDVRLEKAVRIAGAARLAGFMDVFNVFNANPEQNVSWASGTFLQPLTIVSPRIARVGLKIAW